MAWLAVIFSLPFVGAGFYLLFGEKRLGRSRAARITANAVAVQQWQKDLRTQCAAANTTIEEMAKPLRSYVEQVLAFPALPGNEITLIENFQSFCDAVVADINRAKRTVHVCFYIWHMGGHTADVIDALVHAARRGVRCRALTDATGSKVFLASDTAGHMRAAGVELIAALPTGPIRTLFARSDLRNHRKIVVIDDLVAYAGSHNLADPRYFKQGSGVGEWVDAMARITGPAAACLSSVFLLDWSVETAKALDLKLDAPRGVQAQGDCMIQVVPSGPGLHPEAIHQLLLMAIYAARRELVMTTPYFVPDESVLTALLSAALRGVEVTLIVPARNDSLLVRYASAAHFDDLMSAGVRIAFFNGGLLHTKSLTVDGEVSIFGSVNLDMRSLWLNFEISLFVYDTSFTSRLRSLQNTYQDDSNLLRLDIWRRRPAWRQFIENSFRLLGPLL